MKKGLCVFLAAVLLAGCFFVCTGFTVSKPAVVEGEVFGGAVSDKIPVSVTFDTAWLTKEDNTVYHPELARFSALLCADSYFREKDYAKQRQNRVLFEDIGESDYDFTSFLKNAGFTETEHYESYSAGADTTDRDDSVTLTAGHAAVDGYDVYAVVIRGSFSAGEWCSAFDPGCGDPAYEELTGAHPDWKNVENFKGVDVAANRAITFLTDFMERTGDASLEDRILITGHSRGGGIANLLGGYYEKAAGTVSYVYTFNPMAVTFQEDAAEYESVFNVFDSGDLLTDILPFAEGAFTRYGKDLSVSVADSEELRGAIAELKGRDDYVCMPAEAAERYRELFGKRFPSREKLCGKESITRTFATAEEAEADREACLKLIGAEEGFGIAGLCSAEEIVSNADGSYAYTLEYCGQALLRCYALLLAYGESVYAPFVTLFDEDETACDIASLLHENSAALDAGHFLINTYVLAGALEG